MKIISWNVNGIRSVYRKNFSEWLAKSKADIVCLQEIKAQEEQLNSLFADDLFSQKSYHLYSNPAQKSGYSGVACFVKQKPSKIEYKLGMKRFDEEGRMLVLEYPEFTLLNLYIPHGGREKENMAYKLEVYDHLLDLLKKISHRKVIAIGDFNIAHKEIDLARPQQNQNNTMFTSEERKQIDRIIALGFVDTFRQFHKEGGAYTWLSYLANVREQNLGWRIDYAFISRPLLPKLKDAFILKDVPGSDHCPIGLELSNRF